MVREGRRSSRGPRGLTFSTQWKTRWGPGSPTPHSTRPRWPSRTAYRVGPCTYAAGRGLVLTTDVEPGEVLLKVPHSILLHGAALSKRHRLTCAPRKRHATDKPASSTLSSHQIIAYALALWRAANRPLCYLSPFLESLPDDFATAPLTWQVQGGTTHKKLLAALSSTARMRADKVHNAFERDWDRLQAVRTSAPSALHDIWACLGPTNPAKEVCRADFLWGWLCTNSRCVYMDLAYAKHEDNFTLAPLLDMANHTPVPWLQCKVRYDPRGGLELLAPSHPRPECAGRYGWRKGDEVCITYGAHANSTLLAEYGFVLPAIIHAEEPNWKGNVFCDVQFDDEVQALFTRQGDIGQWKRALLEHEGYWGYVAHIGSHSDYSIHPFPAPAHPSHRLHTALRLLCMEVEQGGKRQRTSDNTSRTQNDTERVWRLVTHGGREKISNENENAVRSQLIALCSALCDAHTTRRKALDALPRTHSTCMVQQVLQEEQSIAQSLCDSIANGNEW